MADPFPIIRKVARRVRADHVPDPRTDVFEVRTRRKGPRPTIDGATTVPGAVAAFREALAAEGVDAAVRIRSLPDPALAPRSEALVRAPVAPLYRRPTMNSTQLSQYVMGGRLTLLSRRGAFWRVRGEDAHVGWVHRGYLHRGEPDEILAWERGSMGEPAVSLGAELCDDEERTFARLPWGARVIRTSPGRVLLPDGRAGRISRGEVVPVDRLFDRFPARGESVVRTALGWLGAPYLWGGVTPHGVDCSGFVQGVFWFHGVALPRDSDMQARVGAEAEPGARFRDLHPGDLVFFAARGRIDHVALSTGAGGIVHASASNGGVATNDLAGDGEVDTMLRETFVGARRLLPD